MISIARLLVFTALIVQILTNTSYGQNTQTTREYAADIEFNDKTRVLLHGFSFKDGPLTAKIGDSQITIQYESVSSIGIGKTKGSGGDSVVLSLIPKNNESPLTIRRSVADQIVGRVINDKLVYEFSSPLANIKKIVIVPGSSVQEQNNATDNVSCEIVLSNGDKMTLNEVNLYSIQYKETGYTRGMFGIGSPVKEQEYEVTIPGLKMKNGIASVPLSQIAEIDLKKVAVVLISGETISPVRVNKTQRISGVIGFSVLEGMENDRRVAIELSDLQNVSIKSVTAGKHKPQLEPNSAKPIARMKVSDNKGKSLVVRQATIVSLRNAVSISRILMNRTDVNWQVVGEGNFQNLVPVEEHLQTLAIKYGGYWRLVDISDIKQLVRKGKKDTLIMKSGNTISGATLDFGVIEGKGTWGNVKYNPSDISSLEIIEQ